MTSVVECFTKNFKSSHILYNTVHTSTLTLLFPLTLLTPSAGSLRFLCPEDFTIILLLGTPKGQNQEFPLKIRTHSVEAYYEIFRLRIVFAILGPTYSARLKNWPQKFTFHLKRSLPQVLFPPKTKHLLIYHISIKAT